MGLISGAGGIPNPVRVPVVINDPLGSTGLTVNAAAGASVNGDTLLSVIGDTTGVFEVAADGGIGANGDAAYSGHTIKIGGNSILRADADSTLLAAAVGSTFGVTIAASGAETGVIQVKSGGKLGFFLATPVVKPTGVAVTAAGIHAALVTLGLIGA